MKFKKRYVLGIGYPVYMDDGDISIWREMKDNGKVVSNRVALNFPALLIKGAIPKYRLVLERVK